MLKRGRICLAKVAVAAALLAVWPSALMAEDCSEEVRAQFNHFEWSGRLKYFLEAYNEGRPAARAEAATCFATFPASMVQQSLLDALSDNALEVRVAALESLGRVHAVEATPEVIKHLDARRSDERIAAVTALAAFGDPEYASFVYPLLKDSSGTVREAAVLALDRLREPTAVQELIPLLGDEVKDVAVATHRVLAHYGDTSAVYAILEQTEASAVAKRVAAIKALGDLGDERATSTLIELLQGQPQDVERAALKALIKIGDPTALESLEALLDGDSAYDTQLRVVRAMGTIGGAEAAPTLLRMVSHDLYTEAALGALVQAGPEVVPAVIRELEATQDPAYKARLIELLGRLDTVASSEVLISALKDPAMDLGQIARALGHSTSPVALEALIPLIPELDEDDLISVLIALGDRIDDRFTLPLLDRYESASKRLRLKMLFAFATIKDPLALPTLEEELGQEDQDLRLAALYVAQFLDPVALLEPLLANIDAEQAPLREQAIVTLASAQDEAVVEALLKLVRKPAHPMRKELAWALALAARGTDHSGARKFALEIIEDPKHALTFTALDILETLGSEDLEEKLPKLFEDGRISVQRKVIELIGVFRLAALEQEVLAALEIEDEGIAAEAAWVAGELGLNAAAPRLRLLAESASPLVANNAIVALGQLGVVDAVSLLERRILDENAIVAASAIRALSQLEAPVKPLVLEGIFERNQNPFLRETVLLSLNQAGEGELVNHLLGRFPHLDTPQLRALLEGQEVSGDFDNWVVFDLKSTDKAAIFEVGYFLLPDGRIKAVMSDENGKIRLELATAGRVRQRYGERAYTTLEESL